jgi:hypothetical protein
MSNLNVNNIDVQRIINVLNEFLSKSEICSFLTFKTMEKVESRKDEFKETIRNDEFWKDLEDHYNLMKEFRKTHLIEEIEVKEEKSINGDDEDEEEQNKIKKITREKENLKNITEKTDEITKLLAKNTRNFCRKYYREKSLIEYLLTFRGDDVIITFIHELKDVLYHNMKKCKMTKEEELSDKSLHIELSTKIQDLETQIIEKQNKYSKLKQDHDDLKNSCLRRLEDINREIELIKSSTDNELKQLEDSINRGLSNTEESHKERVKKLDDRLRQVTDEFREKKNENDNDEKVATQGYTGEENKLRGLVKLYDDEMDAHKQHMLELRKENDTLKNIMDSKRITRDKKKEQFELYYEAHNKHVKKLEKLDYEENVKIACAQNIQAAIRGFFTRKPLLKKYKFLRVLRLPKIIPIDPNDKKNKKNNKKK